MKICLVYDCLYPWTVGGMERLYRSTAEALAADGHDVTYLTRRQWAPNAHPAIAGVRVIGIGAKRGLYTAGGRRRVAPPVWFGLRVLGHLARVGGRYDVVHTASFPYFPLLAAAAARRRRRFRLVVDWPELWTRQYWRDYAGVWVGEAGWRIQSRCAQLEQRALCFSELTATRLRASGQRDVVVHRGLHTSRSGDAAVSSPADPPTVVFAGRLVPEKNVASLVEAVAVVRRAIPDLRLAVFGDGPDRAAVARAVSDAALEDAVTLHGIAPAAAVADAMARAACVASASEREGYGMIVVEAVASGCPVVVARGPDNAAVELVEDGVNGAVAASATADDLADAIARVLRGGESLRATTAAWYHDHADVLSFAATLAAYRQAYAA